MIELNQLRMAMKARPAVDIAMIVIIMTFSGGLILICLRSVDKIWSYSGVRPKCDVS